MFTMDIVCFSFVLLLINGCMGQVSIVTSPINRAVTAGSDASFECKVQQSLQTDFVSWSECITSADCLRISNDLQMVYTGLGGDPIRGNRYSVSNPETGKYDIKVTGTVLGEDFGKYKCSARNAALEKTAELILLDGNFTTTSCTRNTSIGTPDVATEGDIIRMECEKAFRGRWAPVIKFDENGSELGGAVDESTTNNVKFSYSLTMTPDMNGRVYGAKINFNNPTGTGPDEATNKPDYEQRMDFPAIEVLYKPRNIRVLAESEGCLTEGNRISCDADGNPSPNYQWRDTNTSEIISDSKVITVTLDMLGSNRYSCQAYNTIGDAEEFINFEVCSEGSSGPGKERTGLSTGGIAGIAVAAVVVVVVIIVILVCCCRKDKEKQKQANETRPNMTRGPDVIRSPDSNIPPKSAAPPPYPDEKVGHNPGPYDPYGRSGPYDVEVPPYDDVDNDDPKNRNVENLTYADLALEDIPRSRKPIQVLDPTEYAEIRRDDDGRMEPTHHSPIPAPRASKAQLVGSGMVPPSPNFRKQPARNNSNSPSRSKPPSRNNSTGSFNRELSLPHGDHSLTRSDSTDSSGGRREPLLDQSGHYPPQNGNNLPQNGHHPPQNGYTDYRYPPTTPDRPPPQQAHPRSRSPGRSPFAPTMSAMAMDELQYRLSNPTYASMSEV